MVANAETPICPNCKKIDFNINSYSLIDENLNIDFECGFCGCKWKSWFGLYYLGCTVNNTYYNRDGVTIDN